MNSRTNCRSLVQGRDFYLTNWTRSQRAQHRKENGAFSFLERVSCPLKEERAKIGHSSNPKMCSVTQSCPTLCGPMNCSPSGSSVHGIFQARISEWGATAYSRGSSPSRDRTHVPALAGRFFTTSTTKRYWAIIMV